VRAFALVADLQSFTRALLARYPEVHDGYDRLGMVYEARGQNKQAADSYRRVIEFVRQRAEQYDPQFEKIFQSMLAELDPPAAT
jgi:Tfp pilus assembly protein PilF